MSVVSVEKDFDSLSLTLIAEFDAPIARGVAAVGRPAAAGALVGPPRYPATVEKHDLAAGGEVTYVMTQGARSRAVGGG